MHYELWEFRTRNIVNAYATEDEALATVRAMLAAGWSVDDLALGLEHDESEDGDDATLPPVLQGAALLERAQPADPERAHISA